MWSHDKTTHDKLCQTQMTKMMMRYLLRKSSVFQSFSCKTRFWLQSPNCLFISYFKPFFTHLSCRESSSGSGTDFFRFFSLIQLSIQPFFPFLSRIKLCAALFCTDLAPLGLTYMALQWYCFDGFDMKLLCTALYCIFPVIFLLHFALWHHGTIIQLHHTNIAPCTMAPSQHGTMHHHNMSQGTRALLRCCSTFVSPLHIAPMAPPLCQRWG